MQKIRSLSLNVLVLLVITFVAVSSTALVQYQNYTTAVDNELERVEQKHLLVAKNLTFALDRYVDDLTSVSHFLWNNLQSAGNWQKMAKDMGIVSVGVKQGSLYTFAFSNNPSLPQTPEELTELTSFLDTVTDLQGSENTRVSGLLNVAGQQVFSIAMKQDERTFYTLLPLDYVRSIQASIQFGDRGHSAIFDQYGNVLAHPNLKLQESGANLAKVSIVQQMIDGETGVDFFYSPPMQADMIAGHTTLERAGWGIMVPQPIEEIKQGVLDDIRKGTVIGVAALLAFIFMGFLMSKRLTSSIARNIENLKRISDGDEVVPDPSNAVSHESQLLSAALVSTAQQVQESRERLSQALNAAKENIRQQNEFIDRVNHEIRTPLNGIAGAGELIDADVSPDEIAEYKQITLDSVRKITAILEYRFASQELIKENESK